MEVIITISLSFITAIVVAFISFKYFRKRIKKFKGSISTYSDASKLFSWIFKKQDEILFLDINLSQKFANEFIETNRFSSPEYDDENIRIGGVIIEFRKDDLDVMFIDMRPTSNRIKGYFKVYHTSGPQQGWFLIILKSVQLESVYNNL